MIVVTSINPNNIHKEAILSWLPYGEIFSLNTPQEIKKMDIDFAEVEFVETRKTLEQIINRPLISINEMFDLAISYDQDMLLINSDIIIKDLPDLKEDGITIFSRYDFEHTLLNEAKKFEFGFDIFYIPKKFLRIYPPSLYALGMSFFDFSIPLRYIFNNVPVYYSKEKHAFHKKHETRYSIDEWLRIAELFRYEFNIDRRLSASQIAQKYMQEIKSKLIEI